MVLLSWDAYRLVEQVPLSTGEWFPIRMIKWWSVPFGLWIGYFSGKWQQFADQPTPILWSVRHFCLVCEDANLVECGINLPTSQHPCYRQTLFWTFTANENNQHMHAGCQFKLGHTIICKANLYILDSKDKPPWSCWKFVFWYM